MRDRLHPQRLLQVPLDLRAPEYGPGLRLRGNTGGGVEPANAIAPAILPFKGEPVVVNVGGGVIGIDGEQDVAPPPGADVVAFGSTNDSIWEKTVVAWSILALVFLLLSVQFVSPTRRWRLRRGPSPVPNPEAR